MSKKSSVITATIRAGEEVLQVSIDLPNDYPDALATARAEAVRGVRELAEVRKAHL